MKYLNKKVFSVLMAIILLAGIVPLTAGASDSYLSKLPFSNNVVGNTKYSDCVGTPTVVVFGRVTYGNTITELPLLDQIITQNNLQDRLNLIFFDPDQTKADIRAFVKDNGLRNVSVYSGGNDIMWKIVHSVSSETDSVFFPVVAYFSSAGTLTNVTTGNTQPTDIIDFTLGIIDADIDVYSLPILAAYAGNVEKHSAGRTDRAALIYYRDYDIDKISDKVMAKAEEITLACKNDYERILAIHDWVAQNIYFDYDDYYKYTRNNNYDSLTVLSTRKSVCEGYSNLTVDLLRSVGVPAKKVTGYALGFNSKEPIMDGYLNHAWTEAFADGRWIVFDTTWNSCNEWRNGTKSKSGGLNADRPFFDLNMENFSCNYRIDKYTPGSSDIPAPSGWAAQEVQRANSLELVPDALNTAYQGHTTRAEFCALAVSLYESINGEITGRTTFADTKDVNVEKMASLGIVSGTGSNKFNPNGELTREQAAAILSRLASELGCPLDDFAPSFADNSKISNWAVSDVGKVQFGGIMGGTGNDNFNPQGKYTHEQSIVTAIRIWDMLQ